MTLTFANLPADAVQQLKPLDRSAFDLLSIDAANVRAEEERAACPTDPRAAVHDSLEALQKGLDPTTDDPNVELGSTLHVVLLALSPEEDLGAMNRLHLALLLKRAKCLAQQVSANKTEARLRLVKATRPSP